MLSCRHVSWLSASHHHACRLYFYHFLQHYFSFSEGCKAFLCTRLPLPISNMTGRTSSPPYFAFESLCSVAVGVVEVKDMSSVFELLDAKSFYLRPILLRARGQRRSIRTWHLDSASHLFLYKKVQLIGQPVQDCQKQEIYEKTSISKQSPLHIKRQHVCAIKPCINKANVPLPSGFFF